MRRKIISYAVLLFFLWFDIGCTIYSTKLITPDQAQSKNEQILLVLKKTGEEFEFPKEAPGTILGNEVVGEHFQANKGIDIADSKQIRIIDQKNRTMLITMNDGKVVNVENARAIGGQFYQMIKDSIPFSEIRMLQVKEIQSGPYLVLLVLAISFAILLYIGFSRPY